MNTIYMHDRACSLATANRIVNDLAPIMLGILAMALLIIIMLPYVTEIYM